MALFGLFKKKAEAEPAKPITEKPKIEFTMTTIERPSNDFRNDITPIDVRIKKCVPSAHGLYPHEILMLHYAEKYKTQGNTFQQFWLYDYGVSDPEAVLQSLVKRGFVTFGTVEACVKSEKVANLKEMLSSKGAKVTGKKDELVSRVLETFTAAELDSMFPAKNYALTELGKSDLADNEYVTYLHSNKYYGLDAFKLNRVLAGSTKRYRDAIWRHFNDQLMKMYRASEFGLYRNTLGEMARFVAEEGRYKDAIKFTFGVVYSDLNCDANRSIAVSKSYARDSISHLFPYEGSIATIAPGVVRNISAYQEKLGINDEELWDLLHLCKDRNSDFPFTLFTKDECIQVLFLEKSKDVESLEKIYKKVEQRYRKMLR